MPFLMLGEALVDLICEQAAEGIGDAGAFPPHFGGAGANVAVNAARAGGEPTFAIYGEGISAALVAFGERLDEAVGATEALVFATLLARLQAAGWNAADRSLRDALGAAAEAGARATESWGAVA